ncbi:MAG: PQQ-binding-like beta-propeller repeat protein [Armatimonadia bacterium]
MKSRALIIVCILLALPVWGLENFTFVHLSDVHYPHLNSDSAQTIASLPRGPVELQPYGVTAEAPVFALVTGDLNEFGGGDGNWQGYLDLWKAWPRPVHHQLGNHDNTWDCNRPRLERLEGSAFYAFSHGGAKFIGFDTATPQDPRPSVATEGLRWLTKELAGTPAEQPVFFFCHHPLNSTEFASAHARERLQELLQTRNVVLILDGHGHGMTHRMVGGFDAVMGGSTYGPRRGYGIVSVKDGMVRVCHQFLGNEPKQVAVLEKPMPARSPFLQVQGVEPTDGCVRKQGALRVAMGVTQPERVAKARWMEGEREGEMRLEKGVFRGELPADLEPGAHAVKLELTDAQGIVTFRWRRFWVAGGGLELRWARQVGGECQAPLTVVGRRLYVGSNDGILRALNRESGQSVLVCPVGGQVRSQPLVLPKGRICVGNSRGELLCLTADGKLVWRYQTGAAVYASPMLVGNRVVCANNDGDVVALDAGTGRLLWRCDEPIYAIESGVATDGQQVFAGSWDGHVYAIGLEDGKVRWKALSRGSNRSSASRYYSPADATPVVAGGNLFVADRGYKLTVYDRLTGALLPVEGSCSAVGTGTNGSVYLRHPDGRVSKRLADGTVVWEAKVPTGYLPVPPVEAGGRVWVTSDRGILTGLDAAQGTVVAQCQVSPGMFMFAAPAATQDEVYVAEEAGWVLGLKAE